MPSTDDDRIETLDQLRAEVDRIGAVGEWDDESAHGDEDALRLVLLRKWLPDDWMAEVDRLRFMDFARWCA